MSRQDRRRTVTRRNCLRDLVESGHLTGRAALAAQWLSYHFERTQASPPGLVPVRGNGSSGDRRIDSRHPGCESHDIIERVRLFLTPSQRGLLSVIWTAEKDVRPLMHIEVAGGYKDDAQKRACTIGHIQALMHSIADWQTANAQLVNRDKNALALSTRIIHKELRSA